MSRKELPRPGLVAAAMAGRISNREGARALHMTPRQFQRLKQRVRESGAVGLRHQGRGRPSHRRLAATLAAQVQALLRDRYAGFNDSHVTEKLREQHGLAISRESVRRLRRALGLPAQHRRRPAQHRRRRPRERAAGRLIQVDGSPFAWFEGRGPVAALLGAVDDATGAILALHFRPTEDLHGYATLFQQVFRTHGLPLAVYGDRLNILIRNDRHWTLREELQGRQEPTHLGRILQELGVAYIAAHSPQAKGRIERLWNTLQDRLTSELRLRGIAALEAAEAFLPEFIDDFNRRFMRPPAQPTAVWRRPPRELAEVLSCRYTRRVARDNTVRLGTRWLSVPPGPRRRSYAGCRVEVRECLDGRVQVRYEGQLLAEQASPGAFQLRPRQAPGQARPARRQPTPRPITVTLPPGRKLSPQARAEARTGPQHPWSRSITLHKLHNARRTGG